MRRVAAIVCVLACVAGASPAVGRECANPNALGTSRTLVIDTGAHPRLGAMQYLETLPLAPGEVVITFDDGPLPPYTSRILDVLAAECVKATYFLVGRMAQNFPELVQRIRREGHTIGTHSLNHPLTFDTMAPAFAQREIDGGFAAVRAALDEPSAVAPFFRFPGLLRAKEVESYLASRSLVTWSADFVADDWHKGISAKEVMQRALRRIEAKGRGILLLHDIQPATVLALPGLLKGLKERGFRVVHVVPSAPDRPKTYTEPQQWAAYGGKRRASQAAATINANKPVPSRESFGIDYAFGEKAIAFSKPKTEALVIAAAGEKLPFSTWPQDDAQIAISEIRPFAPDSIFDWTQNAQLEPLSSEPAVWPEPIRRLTEARPPSPAAASRNRPARPATAKPGCRGVEFATAGLGPRCRATGHQLSLSPRGPAG